MVGWGVVYHATRDSRVGTASLYCSKGYPCFRVPTVAPGPTSGEDTSLQATLDEVRKRTTLVNLFVEMQNQFTAIEDSILEIINELNGVALRCAVAPCPTDPWLPLHR